MTCLVPVPWHCDPHPRLATVVVNGDDLVGLLVIVLLVVLILLIIKRL